MEVVRVEETRRDKSSEGGREGGRGKRKGTERTEKKASVISEME